MNYVDILSIDSQIHQKFINDAQNLSSYQDKLSELERAISVPNLSTSVRNNLISDFRDLQEKIDDVRTRSSLNFYLVDSTPILEEYKKLIQKPQKVSFLSSRNCGFTRTNPETRQLIHKYIDIARKYLSEDIINSFQLDSTTEKKSSISIKDKRSTKIVCDNCDNKTDFEYHGSMIICLSCSAQQESTDFFSPYKESDRINVYAKYTYDRKVHFRDGIYQYQGKQNSTIHQKVYDDLIEQFEKHRLLIGDKLTPKLERFANIEKEHVYMFLGETGHTKHYEDANLIYHNLTGKSLDDISHLEDQLLADFDIFIKEYDKKFKHTKKIDRKNSLNIQYLLYQFLKRHKHHCKKEDFNMLKTLELKALHDQITSEIFESLGWNMNSALF